MPKKLLIVPLAVFLWLGYRFYTQPLAIVIPHHNAVASLRSSFVHEIAQKRLTLPKLVVVISPNHFGSNQKSIYYSTRTWQLQNQSYDTIASYEPQLNTFATKDNSLALSDHGVYNVLADLKTNFPASKVLTFQLGWNSNPDQLITFLKSNCRSDCLLVGSVDFSHYIPEPIADLHDQFTLKTLENNTLTLDHIPEVDCPACLYALQQFSNAKFKLLQHTNIATTSHFMGFWAHSLFPTKPNPSLTKLVTSLNKAQLDVLAPESRLSYGYDQMIFNSPSLPPDQLRFTLQKNSCTTTFTYSIENQILREDNTLKTTCN